MTATSRPSRLRAFADHSRTLDVVGRAAVREIEANDVDAGRQHPLQDRRIVAGGTEGGDDLGIARHGASPRVFRILRAQCYADSRRSGKRRECVAPPWQARFSLPRAFPEWTTAGSDLPSRNSRNAPPPVEM